MSGPDETVSFEHAARMLAVSDHYLTQLLDARAIPFELVGGQRHIRVLELDAYRERRAGAVGALRAMGAIANRAPGSRDT